jgi:hypothetical protein
MMSQDEYQAWLRRCRVIVVVYVGLILLVGLVYIGAKLIGAEFAPLFIGLVATIAGCGLGAVAWGGIWLAGLVHEQGEQLERQRERIACLEAALQLYEAQAEARAVESDTPTGEPEVAAEPLPKTEPAYPRIVQPVGEKEREPSPTAAQPPAAAQLPAEEAFESALAAGDLTAATKALGALNGHSSSERMDALAARLQVLRREVARRLREEFAALIHEQDYRAALRKGEEIAALLPASRMRSDFDVIRPHLEARAAARA